MNITLNGKIVFLDKKMMVDELLKVTKAQTPEYVTVQINNEFIDKADFGITPINEGDTVEYLYFMGGGQ
ncbi:sulfur carrier protein ThiS [Pectinatus frisingensis]|uniref:sulfur carrier protein ThiS n=1 Tax=Pectinatus frisingensis TaxID=865 RepID=UPI0018C4AD15|nr:sulfur carrier protein ThiS [Pectinatus frisingensis]